MSDPCLLTHSLVVFIHRYVLISNDDDNNNNNNNVTCLQPSIEINMIDPGPLTHSLVVFLYEMNPNNNNYTPRKTKF